MDYADADFQNEARPRPGGVTAIGVITLIFGVLGFCFSPVAGLQMFNRDNPAIAPYWEESWIIGLTLAGTVLGWLFSIVDIALGIGLLKFKPWARSGTVVFMLFKTFFSILMTIVNLALISPRVYKHMPNLPNLPPGFQKNIFLITTIGTTGCISFMVLYQFFIVYYLTRPKVKASFQG